MFSYLISFFLLSVRPVLLTSIFFPSRALADTRQIGKLTREQFALAMHLIQQKVSKGIDPPQTLSADMIPPSERGTPIQVGPSHSANTFTRTVWDYCTHESAYVCFYNQPLQNNTIIQKGRIFTTIIAYFLQKACMIS